LSLSGGGREDADPAPAPVEYRVQAGRAAMIGLVSAKKVES